jgi:NAD(P)-dependent dehydrogenase (short-subunit alcohol dehydrogenase family)
MPTPRVVVVTGGAKGIGAATVEAFLREGDRVAVLDVDPSGEAFAAGFGDAARFFRCNVADGADVARTFADVITAFGGVDVLVNNAGIQRYGTVVTTPEAVWDEVMGVNVKSAYLCAQQAIPSMQARGGGVVVNVASVQSFITQSNAAAYGTSKAAMLGLTRSIAVDFAPAVRCVVVCPGTVDTPMVRGSAEESGDVERFFEVVRGMHPVQRIAVPAEVADLIVYLASPRAGFITGQAFRIDGGLGISIPGSVEE